MAQTTPSTAGEAARVWMTGAILMASGLVPMIERIRIVMVALIPGGLPGGWQPVTHCDGKTVKGTAETRP